MHLITKAAQENDNVLVFVSTSDRKKKGEVPIYGADMEDIWKRYIEPTLPPNVQVEYGGIPVRKVWETLGEAEETGSPEEFTVYSDPTDLSTRFPEKSLLKYTGNLWRNGQITLVPIERSETGGISGTRMRQYLATGKKDAFIKNLPPGVDGDAVWNTLRKNIGENVLREWVNLVVRY
jgi:hypothetical protein